MNEITKAKPLTPPDHLAGIEVTPRQIPDHLLPDERNQFLMRGNFTIEGEQWAHYDAWGLELACKLITFGYPVDLDAMAAEMKNWPMDCEGRDRFSEMTTVYLRARNIAESSVIAGVIKAHDTPKKWIAWAKRKGYAVDHLLPALKIVTGGTAVIEESETKNWILLVQAEATRIWKRFRDAGANPTKNSIKTDLAAWCRKTKVLTDTGISPSGDYIERHALRKWNPPKC